MLPAPFFPPAFWFNSETDIIVEQTLQFIAALEVFSRKCNFFVGTFSSNVGRLIALLRAARGWDPQSSASTDDPSWYWGRRQLNDQPDFPFIGLDILDQELDFRYRSPEKLGDVGADSMEDPSEP